MSRRSAALIAIATGLLVLVGVVVAGVLLIRENDDGGDIVSAPSPTASSTRAAPEATPTAVACLLGGGDWALDESLHGDGGRILNSGLPDTSAEAAIEVLLAAARKDPFVLRQLLLDYGVDNVPSVEELRCVDTRREWWLRLDGIFQASETDMVSVGEALREIGIQITGDTVTIENSMIVNGNVEIVESAVNIGEQVLSVKPPGVEKPVFHRTFCANVVVPPGEEVKTPTPVPTKTPGPRPTPSATPVPTPTPRATPTPIPVPPKCLVTILGPHRLDNTQTHARMQASIQWDIRPNFSPTIKWFLNGAFTGGGEQVQFMATLNVNHTLTVQVLKGSQVICSDSTTFAEGSIPPGDDGPGTDPVPTETPIPAPSPTSDPDDGYGGP